MKYSKIIEQYGEKYSIEMTEQDIVGVLDRLSEFYEKYGVFGEALQQCDGAQINAINVLSELCDFNFKIMEAEDESTR